MVKPEVVVSKCLGFDACRYNGQTVPDRFVEKLGKHVGFKPVCPEVELGLGVPRPPIRIAERGGKVELYQPSTERFLTEEMISFIDRYLSSLRDVDGFILKNRSPSCGLSDVKIHHGMEEKAGSRRGNGFFGGAVLDRYPWAAVEDEGRLRNFRIREHFLIKLFTLARFREIESGKSMGDLVDFHSRHKLLFLAYNQTRYRSCGRIVANHERLKAGEVFVKYEEEMHHLLGALPRQGAMINTLLHAFGWISKGLSKEEKEYFLNTVEEYRDERVPLGTVLHLINSHAIRFGNEYLGSQVLLKPYPEKLAEITDSGKGRDY